MRKPALIILALIFCIPLGAQKFKLKKDQVLADKVPILQFPQTSGKGYGPKDYAVLSMSGDTLMVFDAIEVIFEPLPHERGPRSGGFYAQADLRFADREATLLFDPRYFQSFIFENMKKNELLTATGLNTDNTDAFIKALMPGRGKEWKTELSLAGKLRAKNAARVKDEIGRQTKRRPDYSLTIGDDGRISDSGTTVGSWRKKRTENGLNYYSIDNNSGKAIATLVHDPKTYELVVATLDNKEYVTRSYQAEIPKETIHEIARYLINYGYL